MRQSALLLIRKMAIAMAAAGKTMTLTPLLARRVLLFSLFARSSAAATREMHGSGTTNPSKFLFRENTGATYRAVGSGTGQTEFKEDVGLIRGYSTEPSRSREFFQVPFQLGAVSHGRLGRRGRWRKSLSERSRRGTMRISQRKTRTYPCRAINRLRSSIDRRVEFDVRNYELFERGLSGCLDSDDFGVDATYALPRQGSGNVTRSLRTSIQLGTLTPATVTNWVLAISSYSLRQILMVISDVSLINLDGEDVWPITLPFT